MVFRHAPISRKGSGNQQQQQQKELCVANTWFQKNQEWKITTQQVDMKQKLITFLREKIQKKCKECNCDSMETATQASDRRSG